MDQNKFVFTAVDWLAGIVTSSIVTGVICHVLHANDSKHYRKLGYCDRLLEEANESLDKKGASEKN